MSSNQTLIDNLVKNYLMRNLSREQVNYRLQVECSLSQEEVDLILEEAENNTHKIVLSRLNSFIFLFMLIVIVNTLFNMISSIFGH